MYEPKFKYQQYDRYFFFLYFFRIVLSTAAAKAFALDFLMKPRIAVHCIFQMCQPFLHRSRGEVMVCSSVSVLSGAEWEEDLASGAWNCAKE